MIDGDLFNLKGETVVSRGKMAKTKRIKLGQFGVHYVPPGEIEGRDILPGEVVVVDEAFAQNMIASNRAQETEEKVGRPAAPRAGQVQAGDPAPTTRDPQAGAAADKPGK